MITKQTYKEYLLDTGQFQKSDRIYVQGVYSSLKFNYIWVRRAFTKGGNNSLKIRFNRDEFYKWYNNKIRLEKILKIKMKINKK